MEDTNSNTEPHFELTSGEIVAGNEDLATEILIRLPTSSLARFLWVSKQWLSFISNPIFIRRHTLLYPPSLSGLFLVPRLISPSYRISYVSLEPNVSLAAAFLNSRNVELLHSCNGLLLCRSGVLYYVCNPTTSWFRVLPSCLYMENEFELNLAFDPITSPYFYKVVCVQRLCGVDAPYRIALYSSETCLWSLSDEPVYAPDGVDFKSGIFCNDAIHWPKGTSSIPRLEDISARRHATASSEGGAIDTWFQVLRKIPRLLILRNFSPAS